ncbi:hypothetical protein ILUMI_26658 [Ignelater luminosus]|uniref:Integrase catalytic domain-containing protein n=1 Tax=Ignelater luminosus TaxID=2038154 RepID=A0A8K0C6D3_IGNLU|nr:hypothetical protein ILUMI_26658 [Ignelater luminosus]
MKKKEGETAEEKTEEKTERQKETAEKEKKLAQLEKKDRKCKSQIIQRMGHSHLEYAKDKENSYEFWSSLWVTALEALSKEDLTLNVVKNGLLEEELKRRSTGVTKKKDDSFNTMAFPSTRKFSKEDRRTKSENFRKNVSSKANIASKQFESLCKDEEESESLCFAATTNYASESSISYFLDSEATEHLVCTNVPLSNIRKLKTPIRISVAKFGTHIEANKVGDIDIVSEVNGKEYFIKVKDVLSVPGLNHNLLSVRKMEMNEFEVVFKNGKGLIKTKNCIVAVASRTESQMYLVKCKYKTVFANTCSIIKDINLWHKRFGHLNFESLKKLQEQVEGINVDLNKSHAEICDTYIEGKQMQLSHGQKRQRATRPLERIHDDLIRPITPISHNGKKYVLSLIDDFTHFTAA